MVSFLVGLTNFNVYVPLSAQEIVNKIFRFQL